MTMRNITKLVCCGAALALMLGVAADVGAGKPDKPDKPGHPGQGDPKTQACTLADDSDATSTECTVGVDAKSFGPLGMAIEAGTSLADTFAALNGAGTYTGLGRVLKRQGFLDFTFNTDGSDCRPLEFGEPTGSELPGDVCHYLLQVRYGVYDRKGDSVIFQNSLAWLYDHSLPEGGQLISVVGDTANLQFLFE
jgi:hypothetical protein